jgi:flagellar basal body-associated protein FliL
MYSNIGSFELTHTEKQLTNPIPVQGSVNEDDNKNEKDEVVKDKKPLPTGLKVFLIIIGSIFILIGALVILFFVSNARRRKRDKLRRLRRQEMYEKSRREMLAAKENAKK